MYLDFIESVETIPPLIDRIQTSTQATGDDPRYWMDKLRKLLKQCNEMRVYTRRIKMAVACMTVKLTEFITELERLVGSSDKVKKKRKR